jgi:predicted alpha/beta superfamily hydrolase
LEQHFQPIIRIIEENYEIPQLKRTRRIAALLPHDYDETDKQYPVLYLHDGQNMFNEGAPYGSWEADKALTGLAQKGMKDIIVIAIDHGGGDRISEYLPYLTRRFGQGQGELYLNFLMQTLIPHVNETFRISPERTHTGIGGSSMGGLISLYAGMVYREVFGKVMVFSPSLWISEKVFYQAQYFSPFPDTSIYLYAGEKESESHIPNVRRLYSSLLDHTSLPDRYRLHLSVNPEGTHNEYFWGQEFPAALEWLYFHPY